MANSKYAYVRDFELPDPLLPGVFMLFRLDGHSFHRFSDKHNFVKPNDIRALNLMDHAARNVMEEYPDIVLAFGESDEYSFLLRKTTTLYNRRQSKIVSTLTSYFTSCYVFHWPKYFPEVPLQYPPSFDGRIVLYPNRKHIRDYFAWRQADTHINNLYNTTFWALVQQGRQTTTEAHATLRGTYSKDKHEILFSRFGINYNKLDSQFRKGSVLVRAEIPLGEHLVTSIELLSEAQQDPDMPDTGSSETADRAQMTSQSVVKTAAVDTDVADGLGSGALAAAALTPSGDEDTPKYDEGKVMDALMLPSSASELNERDAKSVGSRVHQSQPKLRNEKQEKKNKNRNKKLQPRKTRIEVVHCDIIGDEFWDSRPEILEDED